MAMVTPASLDDTIAAVATAPGVGGIAIVRISGPQARAVIKKITPLKKFRADGVVLTKVFSGTGQTIDKVLVTTFLAPHSYTGQDTIEINCHGSLYITNKILTECLAAGARLASPGEFTKRAFLAGKIDLTQVEAISEMLVAKTDFSAQLALKHLEGDVSKRIKKLRAQLTALLTIIEASLDFPEEIAAPARKQIKKQTQTLQKEVNLLLANSNKGLLIKNGLNIVIAGQSNVGKSSLFNSLTRANKAIVTNIPGTTRDYLEAEISLSGIKAVLVDTAGLRIARNKVEKIGIERSKEYMASAEIVLYVIDAQKGFTKKDQELIAKYKHRNIIYVLNKIDLNNKTTYPGAIKVSAKENKGLACLEKRILKITDLQGLDVNKNTYISSLRQQEKLIRIKALTDELLTRIDKITTLDLLAVDIRDIIYMLGEITGDQISEEIIKQVFENFCVGK